MGTSLAVAGIVLALVFGAVSLIGLSPPEFLVARICFIIAAALSVVAIMMWAKKSRLSILTRRAIASVVVVLAAAALIGAWLWANAREVAAQVPPSSLPTINGNCNFPGGTNNGIINCPVGTVANPASTRSQCPPNTLVIEENQIINPGHAGISTPVDPKVCIIGNKIEDPKEKGIEVR
jgi:hypothetical protein